MKCKKVVYCDDFNFEGLPIRSRCIKGIILDDTDPDFISFQTARHSYKLNKRFILSITETNLEFEGSDSDGNE